MMTPLPPPRRPPPLQVRPVVVYRLVTEGASVERAMVRACVRVGEGSRHQGATPLPLCASAPLQVRKAAAKSSLGRMVLREGAHWMQQPQPQQGPGAAPGPPLGQVDADILEFWLREDVSDRPLIDGGIADDELDAILDRARALQV